MRAALAFESIDLPDDVLFCFKCPSRKLLESFENEWKHVKELRLQGNPLPLISFFISEETESLLDVGSGYGNTLRGLRVGNVTCVDVFQEALQNLPDSYEKICADARTLNTRLSERKFDMVTAFDFIEHLPKQDGQQLLSDLEQFARKGLLFFVPLETDWLLLTPEYHDFHECVFSNLSADYAPYQTHQSRWTIEDFLIRGYDILEVGNFHCPGFNAFFAFKMFDLQWRESIRSSLRQVFGYNLVQCKETTCGGTPQCHILRSQESHAALTVPFDQYRRYKIIQEAIDLLRDGALLTIVDVGGWPGTLRRFLPGDRVVVADLQNTEGDSVRADGCWLPFPNRSFDAVVSSDTFEHVPPHSRPQFLGELVRVTRGALLLGAPFDDPQVAQAEEILQQLIMARYGERYDFIEEHRQNGLPDLTETLSLLHDAGFDTVVLPNGYLYRWIVGISLWFLLQSQFDDPELSARVNAFYNRSFYRQDNREPSYHKLVVAVRDNQVDLSRLPDALTAPPQRDPTEELIALQTLNTFVQMLGERWSERALQAEAQLRQQEAEVARLTQKHEAQMTRLTQEHQVEVEQAVQAPATEELEPDGETHELQRQVLRSSYDDSGPQASIIIVTYNNLEYTRLCLQSIYAKTTEPSFEVIVVDNASRDATREFLKTFASTHRNVQVILNSANEGFARANNRGAAAAAGEYFVFLNNDTVVTSGWLSRLIYHLQDPQVGMVGPVTNSAGNESRIEVDYQNLLEIDDFAERYTRAHAGQTFEIRMLPFFCLAMRRAVFEQVGPLDERFGIGMFEDDDYAIRAKLLGYKIICAEDVFVHHWGSASFAQLDHQEYWRLFIDNRKKFEEKWKTEWIPHQYRSEMMPKQIRELLESTIWLAVRVEEKEQAIQALSAQVAEKEQAVQALSAQVVEKEQSVQALSAQVVEKEQAVQALSAQVAEITSSMGWGLLEVLSPIRLWVVPLGSRREYILSLVVQAMRVWRREGFRALLREVGRRINPRFLMSWYAFAFDTYKRARTSAYGADLSSLRCPSESGLVSIVLPVYNGADLVREALDSILSQTYPNFEIIAINDGSTDATPEILEEYARKDSRIRVVHQENQKIPRTLSRGFRMARGEFLTWTSCDNRLRPDFLERMVDCLSRHPCWDMVYANLDIIGDDGRPLRNSVWYEGYQQPLGSEHIHLPEDPSELNTWANNYIGAAFLYRDRVALLLGDYSSLRFTAEDYDYFMRVNALLNLRHADFKVPVYEYRFHSGSLTYRDDELGITRKRVKLMVFDDFRRDFYLTPLVWFVEEDTSNPKAHWLASRLRDRIATAGHLLFEVGRFNPSELPRLWVPAIYVKVTDDPLDIKPPPTDLPQNVLRTVVVTTEGPLLEHMSSEWDLCIATGTQLVPPRLAKDYQGWLIIPEIDALFTAVDIRTRSHHLALIEAEIEQPQPSHYKISVIICTYKRTERLGQSIASVAHQTLPLREYEVLVVNNNPNDTGLVEQMAALRAAHFAECPHHFRLVVCPLLGLSHARNAGISEARGEVLCFLDDDAIAREDWLEQVWNAFEEHPDVGAVGGHILLKAPEPRPSVLKAGWEKYWSQFVTGHSQYTEVEHWWEFPWGANWSARRKALLEIGEFRARYGRRGSDFSGGEEMAAASLIQRLGCKVAIAPLAEVLHDVDPKRYTLNHVRRTILAATLVNYQAQKDLYMPMESGFLVTARQILGVLVGPVVARFHSVSSGLVGFWDWLFYIAALFRLLVYQMRDFWYRMRRPIVLTQK